MSTGSDKLAAQILIVDDETEHAEVMAEALKRAAGGGHVCTIVHSVPGALDELRHGQFDVVVTDLRMPNSAGKDGVAPDGADAGLVVLEHARKAQPQAETIMVTAHGDVATARAAFKYGAYDFIEKPLDLPVFRELVNRAAETVLLRHEATAGIDPAGRNGAAGLAELVQHDGFEGIVAGSEPMKRILATVRAVAPSNIPVLITGESGTGKELIAQAIHRNSPRTKNRFVAFNCAGQSETLLEDALFGHVRGAFTGADKEREGVFEYASGGTVPASGSPVWTKGGTLFLDEIGDMPLTMQAKLLRTLENAEVVRLGSNDSRKVDVRFVSATNKDLQKAVEAGSFRQDLYYRIKGAHIHLPALRERREDIPRIARHAIARFASQSLGPTATPPDISDAAMMRLTAYSWPGNVRQLLNVIQNMVVMSIGEGTQTGAGPATLDVRHIPDDVRTADGPEADAPDTSDASGAAGTVSLAGTSLELIEKRAIRETLRLTAGNREQAAKLLGIGERTLYRKLKEYGLR
ncbi:MAG TPA: sigma-54 dependent transcriptional regulator [Phycisphaerales bacterium]|nr:sigma-54 dependent transcriptional regulator [Phycisphaerales bacterium]